MKEVRLSEIENSVSPAVTVVTVGEGDVVVGLGEVVVGFGVVVVGLGVVVVGLGVVLVGFGVVVVGFGVVVVGFAEVVAGFGGTALVLVAIVGAAVVIGAIDMSMLIEVAGAAVDEGAEEATVLGVPAIAVAAEVAAGVPAGAPALLLDEPQAVTTTASPKPAPITPNVRVRETTDMLHSWCRG